jgi:predicted nucleotidyltransferase
MLKRTLFRLTGLLEQNAISYMVIGGYAVAHHGENRLTEDIDITLGVDSNYLKQLLEILSDEFRPRIKNVHNFVEKTNVLPIQDNHNSVKVDLIFSFIDFERNAIQNAESVTINDQKIQIISASDLIIYKLIAARERDIEDIRSILENKANKIDTAYIDKYVAEMREISEHQDIEKIWDTLKSEVL